MKKAVLTMIVMLAGMSAFAQNSTKMAQNHKWTYGANITCTFSEDRIIVDDIVHGTARLGNLAFERNSENNNYRTRISLGWLERTHFCPFTAVDAQYLFPIGGTGLYVYPSAGVYAETFYKTFNAGAQAAAGIEFQLGEKFGIFCEAKYQRLFLNGGCNRIQAGAGLKFAFGDGK